MIGARACKVSTLLVIFVIFPFLLSVASGSDPNKSASERLSPDEAKQIIGKETEAVIQAIAAKDFNLVATYVDTARGVRFSPFSTIDLETNPILSPQDIRLAWEDGKPRVWGDSDSSGEPIRLDFRAYYRKYIYDRGYAKAPVIRFNQFAARSTDRNNFWEIYPECLLVEYFFPATTPDGNDWAALRLAYEKHDGKWFLVGVVHDAWTI
jgi:hypothetical protein